MRRALSPPLHQLGSTGSSDGFPRMRFLKRPKSPHGQLNHYASCQIAGPQSLPISPPSRENAEADFRGEKRSNSTHASTTNPDTRHYKESSGTGAVLCFMGAML